MKIKIKDIRINEDHDAMKRARRDFGDVVRLSESIRELGLLHPIVVEPAEEPSIDGKRYILIAGERRLRACVLNGFEEIEASVIDRSNWLKRKSMELEENVVRKNLDWVEECECLRQLHELKQLEFGVPTGDPTGKTSGWGLRETAALVGRSLASTARDIKLANSLRDRPDIAKKVKKVPKIAAAKIVDRLLEKEELEIKVKEKKISISQSLLYGDCTELIDNIPDESINCLITDPPFAQPNIVECDVAGAATYNKIAETNVSSVDTMKAVYDKLIPKLAKKMKTGAHIYVFTGFGDTFFYLNKLLKENGFLLDELPLIWYKTKASTLPRDFSYVSSYEAIIFGHTRERIIRLAKPVHNVIAISALPTQTRVHPLQKPDELLRLLISNSTLPGDTILDCFAGSAATLKVAREMHRNSIGFEIDRGNYLRAQKWLSEIFETDKGEQNEVQ